MNLPRSYLLARAREVFFDGDATTIRVLLAAGSVGWTIGLWLPLGTFERGPYAWMAALLPDWAWGALFLLHAIGVLWRTFDPEPRIGWGLAVNGFGVLLWLVTVVCITASVGEYSPGSALEWCLIAAALVSLARTGHNEGKGTP